MSVIDPETREVLYGNLQSAGMEEHRAALLIDLAIRASETAIAAFVCVTQSAPDRGIELAASQIGCHILAEWGSAWSSELLSQAHQRGQHTSFAEAEPGK